MTKPKRYSYPSYKGTISVSEFRKLPKDAKIDVMRIWFLERFEDPVHSAPWVDGGYVYINGGPYDADQMLQAEFSGLVSNEAVQDLVEELNAECTEWTEAQSNRHYDDYDDEYEWYQRISSREAFERFEQSVNETVVLLEANQPHNQHFLRLLYVSIITALETYLSDFFINIVKSERGYLQVFVEKYKPYELDKIARSQIFSEMSRIEKTTEKTLRELMWHDLNKVRLIYQATLEITFPSTSELYRAVSVRHDLVHRSGRTPDGQTHQLELIQVNNVVNQAKTLVNHIQGQWDEKFRLRDAEIGKLLNGSAHDALGG